MAISVELTAVPEKVPDNTTRDALDALSQLVYDTVDGASSVVELGTFCGLDREMIANIVGELAVNGYIVLREGAAPELSEAPGAAAPSVPSEEPAPLKNEVVSPAITDVLERLEDRYAELGNLNHYELLEVSPDAGRSELKTAFFTLSKRYHPDRAFGQIDAATKTKMEHVFRRLSLAYEILTNPSDKAAYDATIEDDLDMMRLGASLVQAARQSRQPEAMAGEIKIEAKASQPPHDPESVSPERPSRPAPDSQPAARTSSIPGRSKGNGVRVERISKPAGSPLSGRSQRTSDAVKVERVPSPMKREPVSAKPRKTISSPDESRDELSDRRKEWARQRAGRAVSNMMQHRSSVSPPVSRIDALLSEVRVALQAERYAAANRVLESILTDEPENAEAKELQATCAAGLSHQEVQNHLRQGRLASKHGHYDVARAHLESAIRMEPSNVDARHLLADTLLASSTDLPRALNLAQQVMTLGGTKARYYDTLGQLLYLAKDIHKAEEAFAKAVELDPDNRDYKKRLKSCQG